MQAPQQGYGQPPAQYGAPAAQLQYGAPPQQQPYYDPAQQPAQPQQQPYGAPPAQQQYQGPPGPAQQYNSYAAPAGGPPQGGPPGDPPGPQQYGQPAVGSKRPLEEGGAEIGPEAKRHEHGPTVPETVLRLLVPVRKVGAIIGKHGAVIREIKELTGSRIRIVEGIPNVDERVVVVSSPDNQEERNPAELGLFEVHRRVIDGEEPQPAQAGQPQGILTRLLVCHSQAGSIIGKGGSQIKEIRDMSGSHIKILPPDELPPCALSNDRVVQIVGGPEALARALGEVSRLMRANPPKEKAGGCPPALSAMTGIPPGPQAGGLSGHAHRPSGPSIPSGAPPPGAVTKNVLVPDHQVGSIIGSGGTNINRIRNESGCRIKVHDPNPHDPTQRVIEVTGLPDQIANAERLIEPYARPDAGAGPPY